MEKLEERLKKEFSQFLQTQAILLRFISSRKMTLEQQKNLSDQIKKEIREDWSKNYADHGELYLTLSHTSYLADGALLAFGTHCRVGVDLECRDRAVSDRLYDRIVNDSEKAFPLSALEFWVIKEAAFKATPQNHGTVVSDYHVSIWDEKTRTGEFNYSKNGRNLNGIFYLLKLERWCIAVAATFDKL